MGLDGTKEVAYINIFVKPKNQKTQYTGVSWMGKIMGLILRTAMLIATAIRDAGQRDLTFVYYGSPSKFSPRPG